MAVGPLLAATLRRYGLESLTEWASNALIRGMGEEEIMLSIWDQPAFRTRFAGIFQREAAGMPPISPEEYLQYEATVHALASTWRVPLSKQEVDNLIGNNVSVPEVEERFTIAAEAVYNSPREDLDWLASEYNLSDGQLIRYVMDPKAELGRIQQQWRMGEIAGAALRSGYSRLNQSQALRLQQTGMSAEAATTGFSELVRRAELFSPLDYGENAISLDEQVEALAGDAEAQASIENRAAKRKAEFAGSGGFAAGETGFTTGEAD